MIFELLANHAIEYDCVDHPAIFTVEDGKRLDLRLPGAETKNLFLRDAKHQRFFLLTVEAQTRVDLKALGRQLQISGITFGSPEELLAKLGVTPGAVTLLAVMHDPQKEVTVLIDAELWQSELFQCHPLVNTKTMILDKAALIRFFKITGHTPQIISVPRRT